MSSGPPVPRKPASYSPTFLARSEPQYQALYHHTSNAPQHNEHWQNELDDKYDRDFSLDMPNQALPRSRPSSNGSAYGRPLPSPPSRNSWEPLAMPALHRDGVYDAASAYDAYAYHSDLGPPLAHPQRLSFRPLPKSPSQSSVSSQRPLPVPPSNSTYMQTSLPLPSPPRHYHDDDYDQDEDFSHEFPRNPFLVDTQKTHRREFVVNSRQQILAGLDYARYDIDSPTGNMTESNFHRVDQLSRQNLHAQTFKPLPQPQPYDVISSFDPAYGASYNDTGHSRHVSKDVAALSIASPYEEEHLQGDNVYDDYFVPHGETYDRQWRTADIAHGVSDDPGMQDSFYEKEYDSAGHSDSDDDHNAYGEHYSTDSVTNIAVAQVFSDPNFDQDTSKTGIPRARPPIPQIPHLMRGSTLPVTPVTAAKVSNNGHMKRSSTATTVFDTKDNQQERHLTTNGRSLSTDDYECCPSPWSRSNVYLWAQDLQFESALDFIMSCSSLFCHVVPTLSPAVARKTANDLLDSFVCAQEITRFGNVLQYCTTVPAQGILPIMTGAGCYAPKCHADLTGQRCYSSRCLRTINTRPQQKRISTSVDAHDWAQFWSLVKDEEPLASLHKREIQRQYQIHEVVYSETDYLEVLHILRDVFQSTFPLNSPSDRKTMQLVFSDVSELIALSQQLDQALRERQSQEGPVVNSIGDVFQVWIERAGPKYTEYASKLRYADRAIRGQRRNDPRIRDWLAKCEQDPRSNKLDFSSYQGSPTRRMQRYALLLSEVLKQTSPEYPDYATLSAAIDQIKMICQACDAQVKLASDKIKLMDLQESLIWKIPPKDLALTDSTREIFYSGELQRKSESLTSWQTREVILLDNYLLSINRKETGRATVSRIPIPVDYLVVEDYFEILYKSSSTRIIGGTITHSFSPGESGSRRPPPDGSRQSIPDGASSPGKSATENIYPFTVRHAGRPDDKTTFYAETSSARSAWIKAIFEAKSQRWSKISTREPFEVSIIASQAFGRYSILSGTQAASSKPSNVVELAVITDTTRENKPVTMSRVQCSTIYRQSDGNEVFLIGTDDGVYAELKGIWTKLVTLARVSQIALLEDFGVLTVLADKILIAYTMDDLLHTKDIQSSRIIRKPPQKLSGSKDVGFFEVGYMKDRMLVIYKKRENGNSVFKALEPVVGKKQEKLAFYKKGTGTDFFRDFDQFFIPAECYGMQYLRTTICIKCSRGFEIMSLDSKQPLTIPNLSSANTTTLRLRIENSRPLGTYRVQEGEFLCCYTECGLFVDKYGSVSRPYTLEWEGRPTHALLVGNYVLAIGREFIEVWNVEKRSLRQVITGRDIRLLAHSSAGSRIDMQGRGVVIAMDCPQNPGRQLVFEMRLRQ